MVCVVRPFLLEVFGYKAERVEGGPLALLMVGCNLKMLLIHGTLALCQFEALYNWMKFGEVDTFTSKALESCLHRLSIHFLEYLSKLSCPF